MRVKIHSERIPEFESLRAFLAWWVVAGHVLNASPLSIPTSVKNLIWGGHAVNVFILLSGFVIFLLLDTRHESYCAFIVRRVFRLWPVFLVCFFLTMFMTGLGPQETRWLVLSSNLILFQGAIPESWCANAVFAILPPSWSISLEWQFYLVAPILLFLARRRPWLFLTLIVGLVVIYQNLRDSKAYFFPSFLPLSLHLFLLGGLCYFTWSKAPTFRVAKKLPAALVLAALVFISTRNIALVIWAGVFGYVLLKRMDDDSSETSPGIVTRLTRWLGSISYSTYLCHFFVILLLGRLFKAMGLLTHQPVVNYLLMLVAVAVVTLLLSWMLNSLVEKPGILLGRRLAQRLSPRMVSK